MKKILLFFVAVLASVSVSAQSETDISIESWGWNWNATAAYNSGVMTITLTADYGQGSTGWNSGTDWSAYCQVSVVIDDVTFNGDNWIKIYLNNTDGQTIAVQEFTYDASVNTYTVPFTPSAATAVKQLAIQGKTSGDVIKVSRVYLTKAGESYNYAATGTNLTYDQYGNIAASQFDGLSDYAKVVFTYTTTGELTRYNTETEKTESIVGWGTGSISSWLAADKTNVAVTSVPVQALGDNTVEVTVADLQDALAFQGEHGKGIYWNMYGQGNSTSERKSVTAYEAVKKVTPEYEYITFCSTYDLNFTGEGVTAYIATGLNAAGTAIVLKEVTGRVPAGTGLILKGTIGTEYEIPFAASSVAAADLTGNLLKGVTAETPVASNASTYVLAVTGGTAVEFQSLSANSATVPAYKTYLVVSGSTAPALTIGGGDATGISVIEAVEDSNAPIYDLQGRRVLNPTKGVYIVNGKKVVIK